MKDLLICPHCKNGGTSKTFAQNHFDNCIHHRDPAMREKAIARANEKYMTCERCGFKSTISVIKTFHNENCKNFALVGMNMKTGELRYYRWLHHASSYGFNVDFIRKVLQGTRITTGGHTFREATAQEMEEGRALSHQGLRMDNKRGVRVVRISPDGEETYFDNIAEAVAATPGASSQKISEVSKGDRKTHAGFSWRREKAPQECGA